MGPVVVDIEIGLVLLHEIPSFVTSPDTLSTTTTTTTTTYINTGKRLVIA